MILSIRAAIARLTKILSIRVTKPSPRTSSSHNKRELAAKRKFATQPMTATSLKLDKALVERNQSWSDSNAVNQSNYDYLGPEPPSTDDTHDRKSPHDTLGHT